MRGSLTSRSMPLRKGFWWHQPRLGSGVGCGQAAKIVPVCSVCPGGVTDKGAWAPNTAYDVCDTVTALGSTWMIRKAHTSSPTVAPGLSDKYFRTLIPALLCDFSQATIEPWEDPPTPTFTRASEATVKDYQGKLITVPANVPRFQGARYASNLFTYSNDFSNAIWQKVNGATVSGPDAEGWWTVTGAGNSGQQNLKQVCTPAGGVQGKLFVGSFEIKAINPADVGKLITYQIAQSSGTANSQISFAALTLEGSRCASKVWVSLPDNLNVQLYLTRNTSVAQYKVRFGQLEEVYGATAGQYVAPGPYIATTNQPIQKAVATTNANTVDANGVVTEAPSAHIPGIAYLAEAADSLTYAPIATPNQVIIDGQVTDDWDGVVPVGEHSHLAAFAPPLSAEDLEVFLKQDWSCAKGLNPAPIAIPAPPPPVLLGPFTAIDAQYWLDPDTDEVLFDVFPPTGEPDLRIAYADLPDVMVGYGEYLAIIQAKIAEVDGV